MNARFALFVLVLALLFSSFLPTSGSPTKQMEPNPDPRPKMAPVDGPVPPPGTEVAVLYAQFADFTQQFRVLPKPLASHQPTIRSAYLRYGQELQLEALGTGNEALRQKGLALVEAAQIGPVRYGGICPCVPLYACGCSEGCAGPGCAVIRVPSIK